MNKKLLSAIKKTIRGEAQGQNRQEDSLLSLELSEIREISDMIFKRLERKIKVLEAIETSVDEKLSALEKLINRAEAIIPATGLTNREQEISALKQKGLKIDEIAGILDMPVGEVELILNLRA